MIKTIDYALVRNQSTVLLDIDSPDEDRFSAADRRGVEFLCERFVHLLRTRKDNLQNFI